MTKPDEFTKEQLGKCASRGAAWLSGRLAAFALKQMAILDGAQSVIRGQRAELDELKADVRLEIKLCRLYEETHTEDARKKWLEVCRRVDRLVKGEQG